MSIFEKCEKNRKNRKTKILRKEKTLRYKNLTLQKGVFSGQGCKKQCKHNKKYKFFKNSKSWVYCLLTSSKLWFIMASVWLYCLIKMEYKKMAYISQETKKAILDSVKKLVKQHDPAIKVTASVRHYSSLIIRLKSDRLVSEQKAYDDAKKSHMNSYWEPKYNQVMYFPGTLNPETKELYKQISNAIHTVGGYYDNSDPTTDYNDCAFYYDCVVA